MADHICPLTPKDLNKVTKREHHLVLVVDDITTRLAGVAQFSKEDATWEGTSSSECLWFQNVSRHLFGEIWNRLLRAPEAI